MAKFYVVKSGRTPGIYKTWAECEAEVKGVKGAKFKSFSTEKEALHALEHGWETKSRKSVPKTNDKPSETATTSDYIKESISVDAACAGNPGRMEYRGVNTASGEVIFATDVFPEGTNNIGEFLAIVDGLKYLADLKSDMPIYTDSVTAMAWVRNKKAKTTLALNDNTRELLWHIDQAEKWLEDHPDYPNQIIKWNTKSWGEIKADYDRK